MAAPAEKTQADVASPYTRNDGFRRVTTGRHGRAQFVRMTETAAMRAHPLPSEIMSSGGFRSADVTSSLTL